ncbi:MAG TPA: calcium/sodium antiporter [Desulfosalsimonadaceae bacterium]|nr:calcium/sodium antiporter [Desulfosalsimonadaceae bacterium]
MILHLILLAAGFLLLYFGAEWLVKGSANLARSLGISAVVIGLTVVAFGTSAPELVVSVISSLQDKSMIAVGNVVGSNICNIALVLGAAAALMPITANRSVVRRDIPLMLAISIYLLLLSLDSRISRIEGATLFAGVILYTIFNYYISIKENPAHRAAAHIEADTSLNACDTAAPTQNIAAQVEDIETIESRPKQVLMIIAGIAGVVIGADTMIDSAVVIMKNFGVSEKFIGLTIVALGTSLPELATSVVAAMKRQMDISIGNLVGSNVFNILSVIGAAGLIRPIPIPGGFIESGLILDYLVMMGISLLPWLMMRKDCTVKRWGGGLLLCCYAGYLGYLIHTG